MKRVVSQGSLMSFAVLSLVLAAPLTVAADAMTDKMVEYYRVKASVPPAAPITVGELQKTPVAGLKKGTLNAGGREVEFLVSDDGRYVAFASLEDVTVDPFKAIMDKINLKGRFGKGPANAKVVIVEYSDYQCPFCSRGYNTIEKEVLKEYGDKVRFYYKNYPLPMHPWAKSGAVAVECAGEQSEAAYWQLYSYLFEHQRDINVQNLKDKTKEALGGTKIDMAKFDACFDGQKTLGRVDADMAEGQSVGVRGTPAFFVNGRFINGAQPFQAFKSIIDGELARQ